MEYVFSYLGFDSESLFVLKLVKINEVPLAYYLVRVMSKRVENYWFFRSNRWISNF